MSASVFGAAAAVTMLNRAFNNASPANAVFNNQVATAGTTEASQFAFATTFAQGFASLSNADLASRVMGNLGMLPNDALLAAFTDYLAANGAESRGVIVLQLSQILSTMENATGDLAIYAPQAMAWNKEVEQSFIYSSNTASTTAYNGDFAPTPVDQGQTFTLTTGIDNVTGTGGNDTIIGDNSGASATVSAGDQVNGGAGTDTFKFYTKTGVAVVAPTLSGVENLFVSGNDTSNVDISTGSFASVSRLIVDNAGATKTYTMGAGDTFAMQNTAAWGANVVYSAVETATTVGFDAVGASGANVAVDLKGAGLATVTLDVANKNYVVLDNSAGAAVTKTVNVTGAGSLVLDALSTTDLTGITKVDASANTGGVTFIAPTSKLAFTGGTGNDEVRFEATKLTADDKLIGGTGIDVIRVKDTAINASTADVVKGLNASSGFETLALGAAASTVDFDVITASGIKNVRLDVAGAQTLNNATNATVVEVAAGVTVGAADLTIANKLGQITTNIKLDATAAGASSVAQLVLTGVSDVKIESDFAGPGAQATANTLTVKTQADNSIFTVTGDHALNLTLKSAATTVGSTVNASGLTKTLTVVGTDKADAITGGSGNDVILGNTAGAASGADTLTGGAGNDTFKFDALSVGVANMSTITDFTVGDKLVLGLATGAFATAKVDVSSAATLADAIGLADNTATNATWFVFGGNTYVVAAGVTTNAITDDNIVKLTGTLDLVASTFDAGTSTLTFA